MALHIEPKRIDDAPRKQRRRNLTIVLPGQVSKPGASDRMFFTEQLALLLETGESLYSALTTIVTQTENPAMRKVVEHIAQDVSEGRSFAHALEQHDGVFSQTYVNLIAASEHGGFIHDVLQQLLNLGLFVYIY